MKKTTDKYLCIHGHFYQPPRENPWADIIYTQKSAYPYHDWNERITRECYGPNTRSRLNGENGYISKLVNNFEQISFNFGPTLLKWLEKYNPWIYAQIIDADRSSIDRFGGHGNAMAQVYNHLIMPLASKRDKITQVKWGLADFYHRFGRKAEGMWLAETAVNGETLEVLADEGVKFTILSPYQAHLIKPFNKKTDDAGWQDVSGGKIDCTVPYRCFPTGDKNVFIDIFFYNGPLSKAIAYEKILASGEVFLKRIMDTYPSKLNAPALVNMATDGESYGHHFKFGEMALTWVLEMVNNGDDVQLTNYGEFLEKFPSENEVRIIENSAWSCAHGIERWRSNCGCSVSQNPGWTQSWRAPLRNGLDWLDAHMSSIFEEKTKGLLRDCWETRDNYISLLLNPDKRERDAFLKRHAAKPISAAESKLIFQLLESQQMALYMFTSCGWFFDDISGIEAVQILMYAKKAIELCRDFSAEDLENGLKSFLSEAACNDPLFKNGMDVYNKKVVPLELDDISFLANYAMVCVMDCNKVPAWLKTPVGLEKEKRIDSETITIFICEATSQSLTPDNKSNVLALALKTQNNELACVIGNRNAYTTEKLLKEINGVLSLKNKTEPIINLLNKHLENTRILTIKDLIPDTKRLVIKMLSDQLEKKFNGPFLDNRDPLKNFLKTLSSAEEDVPSHFNDLFQFVVLDLFAGLFKNSYNLPIEFREVEFYLKLFKHEPEEKNSTNNSCLIRDNILKQKRIARQFEQYIIGQLENIQNKNINLCLINIIKSINFINKYKITLDWWQCQNTFYDLRTDRDFTKNLDKVSLDLFRQIEHLLGFTGGI